MPIEHDQELSRETWRLFRIVSEFVDGFETMSDVGRAVTVFGSARTPRESPYYEQAIECGRLLAEQGFTTVTGGGPGIMEAANKGAYEAGGRSVGLNITLPAEQKPNRYQTHPVTFRYFFVRKVMFVKYAHGFIIFPGGFGTMDEFFESMTLIQTLKSAPFPVVCIGREFWEPLVAWMRRSMLEDFRAINPEDLDLFRVTDDVSEAVGVIRECYEKGKTLGPPLPRIPAEAAKPTGEGTRLGVAPQPPNGMNAAATPARPEQ